MGSSVVSPVAVLHQCREETKAVLCKTQQHSGSAPSCRRREGAGCQRRLSECCRTEGHPNLRVEGLHVHTGSSGPKQKKQSNIVQEQSNKATQRERTILSARGVQDIVLCFVDCGTTPSAAMDVMRIVA
jgi:hypothetical protein